MATKLGMSRYGWRPAPSSSTRARRSSAPTRTPPSGSTGRPSRPFPSSPTWSPGLRAAAVGQRDRPRGGPAGIGFIPSGLAGLGLSIYAGSLTRLYLTAPGTRREGTIAPSQQGIGLAKDSWMLAIGVALVLDSLFGSRARGTRRSPSGSAQGLGHTGQICDSSGAMRGHAVLAVVAALTLAVAAPAAGAPSLASSGCLLFPADNIWHADVSRLPVHPRSGAYVASMRTGADHADFGSGTWEGGPIGSPTGYSRRPGPGAVRFGYAGESDPGPYPIPPGRAGRGRPRRRRGPARAGRPGRQLPAVRAVRRPPRGCRWRAGSGAVWDLRSNRLRPAGWTSADAAGLPILAGLVRYEEVARGRIDHAIRFTVDRSQASYLWPARHQAGQGGAALPPMGRGCGSRPGSTSAGSPVRPG